MHNNLVRQVSFVTFSERGNWASETKWFAQSQITRKKKSWNLNTVISFQNPCCFSLYFISLVLGNISDLKPGWTERNSSIYLRWVISQVQKEADIVHGAIFFKVRFEEPGSFHVYLNSNDFISGGRRKILSMYFWWRPSYRSALLLLLKFQVPKKFSQKPTEWTQPALGAENFFLHFSQKPKIPS